MSFRIEVRGNEVAGTLEERLAEWTRVQIVATKKPAAELALAAEVERDRVAEIERERLRTEKEKAEVVAKAQPVTVIGEVTIKAPEHAASAN